LKNPITNIDSDTYTRLIRLFDIANGVLVAEHNGDRKGSTLHLRNEQRHVMLMNRSMTEVPEDDGCRYDFFASEKTFRLCGHKNHILSWQSSNMDLMQYPGAVRFIWVSVIMAISGFTAEEDEAAVLWIGKKMGWISEPDAYEASQISNNSRYRDLLQKFNEAERLAA
jgi:hypothetical protein